jgi:hypothetical protein
MNHAGDFITRPQRFIRMPYILLSLNFKQNCVLFFQPLDSARASVILLGTSGQAVARGALVFPSAIIVSSLAFELCI